LRRYGAKNIRLSPLKIKKKKFENFLKQLGDSPEKKRDISANGKYKERFNALYTMLFAFLFNRYRINW